MKTTTILLALAVVALSSCGTYEEVHVVMHSTPSENEELFLVWGTERPDTMFTDVDVEITWTGKTMREQVALDTWKDFPVYQVRIEYADVEAYTTDTWIAASVYTEQQILAMVDNYWSQNENDECLKEAFWLVLHAIAEGEHLNYAPEQ